MIEQLKGENEIDQNDLAPLRNGRADQKIGKSKVQSMGYGAGNEDFWYAANPEQNFGSGGTTDNLEYLQQTPNFFDDRPKFPA